MQKTLITSALAAQLLIAGGGAQANVGEPKSGLLQSGQASHYHDSFHGRRTASGDRYNKNALSAAHKTLPLGTQVRVTSTHSGRSVVVRINDRGPFVRGRVIDLSGAAAREIGIAGRGVGPVELEIVRDSGTPGAPNTRPLGLTDLF